MKTFIAQALFQSHSYLEYRKLMADLLKEGKSTAVEQTQERIHYSELNESRMRRLDKTMHIIDENSAKLESLTKRYIWLVLTESWCGDAAQILPILHKMEIESNGKIEMKLVLRDENETLMNHFLTHKGKAIPKLIIIDKETGIKNYKVKINSKWTLFEYEYKRNELFYEFDSYFLNQTKNLIEVFIEDLAGNKTQKNFTFFRN